MRLARTASSGGLGRFGQTIHGLGELDVTLGHAAGIMRRERNLDLVVDVEPLRMMIELLRGQRRAGHEAEDFVESLKVNFRVMASRSFTSPQPESLASALLRAL